MSFISNSHCACAVPKQESNKMFAKFFTFLSLLLLVRHIDMSTDHEPPSEFQHNIYSFPLLHETQ